MVSGVAFFFIKD